MLLLPNQRLGIFAAQLTIAANHLLLHLSTRLPIP
jgi:hypothetical protein